MAALIDNLTNFADQTTLVKLEDGSTVSIELIFHGATERWVMNVTYGDRVFNGVGVCCYPNLMRPWKNLIPFGIACTSANQTDPFNINDFATGRVLLYVLDEADVLDIEENVFGVSQ